jgi:hypothetical protein
MTQVDGPIHVGLDVAKNAIVVGVLLPGREGVDVDRIGSDEASIREWRLVEPRHPGSSCLPHPRTTGDQELSETHPGR